MPLGWIAGAAVVGAGISAVGANMAAGKQEAAANNATNLQSQIYGDTVTRNQPFVQAGVGATNELSNMLGISTGSGGGTGGGAYGGGGLPGYDPSSGYAIGPGGGITQMIPGGGGGGRATATQGMPGGATPTSGPGSPGFGSLTAPFTPADYLANQDPGYQFQLQTGENAVQSRDAATGSAIGGAALKDLNNFAQGTAATGYQSAFDRYQTQNSNVYARLAGLAGIGQASANNTAAAGTSFGQSAGSNMIGAGNAAAAGTVGGINALTSGANNAAGYYYLNSLNGTGGSSALTSGTYSGGYAPTTGGTDFISG